MIYKEGMKPSELLDVIEKKPPLLSNLVQVHIGAGMYDIAPDAMQFADEQVWDDLPRLPWDHILHYWQLFTPVAAA